MTKARRDNVYSYISTWEAEAGGPLLPRLQSKFKESLQYTVIKTVSQKSCPYLKGDQDHMYV